MTETSRDGGLQHPGPGLHPADAVDSPDPGDAVPGDGTVGERPAAGDADALQLSAYGREAEAAREVVADDTPAPRETPAGDDG